MKDIVEPIAEMLGELILNLLEGRTDWKRVILRVKVLPKNVGMSANLIDLNNESSNLRIRFSLDAGRALLTFKEETLKHNFTEWNRFIYTLYSDHKFEMEYIWDQELQDEIDKYDKEGQA